MEREHVTICCFYITPCLRCLCARLFICALWSPAGKGLTSSLSFVVSNFPIGILGQVWYLIFAPLILFYSVYVAGNKDYYAAPNIGGSNAVNVFGGQLSVGQLSFTGKIQHQT